MEVMWLILPLAIGIAAVAVIVFAWAVRTGQFDDLVTPSMRVLVDDDEAPKAKDDGAASGEHDEPEALEDRSRLG